MATAQDGRIRRDVSGCQQDPVPKHMVDRTGMFSCAMVVPSTYIQGERFGEKDGSAKCPSH